MVYNWNTEVINGVRVSYYRYDTQYGPNTGIEYLATLDEEDNFNIATHDGEFKSVPFWCEFDNYREMDAYAKIVNWDNLPEFVCHVAHNEDNAYVLWVKGKSYYIRVIND